MTRIDNVHYITEEQKQEPLKLLEELANKTTIDNEAETSLIPIITELGYW